MGLDMFLYAVPIIKGKRLRQIIKEDNKLYDKNHTVAEEFKPYVIRQTYPQHRDTLLEEVGYWRKANQIHRWFVDNIQYGVDNQGHYHVTEKKLEKLLKVCLEVKSIFDKATATKGMVGVGNGFIDSEWVTVYSEGTVYKDIDIERINELLPTQSGFFFGSTEIDDWYLADIIDTIKILENVLTKTDFNKTRIYYTCSW